MAAKYYAGSPISGKKMDGLTFVFEAIEVTGGSWRGVFKTESDNEISALNKLASDGQVKEITEETYNAFIKKKAVRQATSPNLTGVSEQQAVGHVETQAPKESVDDVLEVQQVEPPKRRSKKNPNPSGVGSPK
jgi:hypothetical protein